MILGGSEGNEEIDMIPLIDYGRFKDLGKGDQDGYTIRANAARFEDGSIVDYKREDSIILIKIEWMWLTISVEMVDCRDDIFGLFTWVQLRQKRSVTRFSSDPQWR